MSLTMPAARGLRTLYDLGAGRFWFAGAVILGLFLASWIANLVMMQLIGPLPVEGFGY